MLCDAGLHEDTFCSSSFMHERSLLFVILLFVEMVFLGSLPKLLGAIKCSNHYLLIHYTVISYNICFTFCRVHHPDFPSFQNDSPVHFSWLCVLPDGMIETSTNLYRGTLRDRPSVNSILRKPFIQKRIEKFLSQEVKKAYYMSLYTILYSQDICLQTVNAYSRLMIIVLLHLCCSISYSWLRMNSATQSFTANRLVLLDKREWRQNLQEPANVRGVPPWCLPHLQSSLTQ